MNTSFSNFIFKPLFRTLLDKTIQGEIDKRKVTPAKAKTLQAETRKLIEEVVKGNNRKPAGSL